MRSILEVGSEQLQQFLDYATKVFRLSMDVIDKFFTKRSYLVLANKGQMRYNESKWGAQMDGLRVDVIVLT